jgi:hypothetical protein
MARGKYAAKAERRASSAGLEERAVTAERERDRLAAELAALRERSDTAIAGLRRQVSELCERRAEVASPRIAELEAANNRLRAQRDEAATRLKGLRGHVLRMRDRFGQVLCRRFGLQVTEAAELIHALGTDSETPALLRLGVRSDDPKTIEVIQRARGVRGKGDTASTASSAQPVGLIGTRPSGRRRPRGVGLKDKLTADYAYDGPEGSISICVIDDDLWIRAECAELDAIADNFIIAVPLPASEAARIAGTLTSPGEQ